MDVSKLNDKACILVELLNSNEFKIGFIEQLKMKCNEKELRCIKENKTEVEVFWPNFVMTNAKDTKKKMINAISELVPARIHGFGGKSTLIHYIFNYPDNFYGHFRYKITELIT